MFYRALSDHLVQENIDDEIIVINMVTGNYYSLRDSATDVWLLLQDGADMRTLCDQLSRKYSADTATFFRETESLLEKLVDEGIVEVCGPVESPPVAEVRSGSPTLPFKPPIVEVYSDVQDLLLLDPIHDVTEAGWPQNTDKVRSPEQ